MYIQNLVKFCLFVVKILCGNEILNKILTLVKGHNSITNVRKIVCNNLNLDLVSINAYVKFGTIYSQDIELIKIMMDRQYNTIQIFYFAIEGHLPIILIHYNAKFE